MEPLAAIVTLLAPRMAATKLISGAGRWGVRYARTESAGFGLVLAGEACLRVDGAPPITLRAGDFVLMPPAAFSFASDPLAETVEIDPEAAAALKELRHGTAEGEPDFRLLGGYFRFDPTNLDLLTGLLPSIVHISGQDPAARRVANIIGVISEEALAERPGADLIVERLVQVLLVEALRHRDAARASPPQPGLLEGLADRNLATALRCIHSQTARRWKVADLAREAGLSRSVFSERFTRRVGTPPLDYLIQWRLAVARDLLQREAVSLETAATAIGYESASAFSTAFRKRFGTPPRAFARAARA